MPRETIKPAVKLEYLSVLTHENKLDKALEPKISDQDLRRLYKGLLQCRIFDERCLAMQRQGRIGTYGPSKGQEAASLGPAFAIDKDDWFVPSFRETATMLWRGLPMEKILLWWGGHEAGSAIPAGMNDLPICVPVGSQCQYAMGIAWGLKLKNTDRVVICFIGDGGTSEGDFHEAMNFAAVYKAPLITIVQNNQWAISVPRSAQTRSETIAQKAIAYGMDGIQVDGNDLLAMIVATRDAVAKARSGGGPTLIEAVTYRLAMHTTADDPKKYRSEEEVKKWECRDPIIRFRDYLRGKKLLDDKIEKEIEREINEDMDKAIKIAEAYQLDRYEFFRYVYQDMTPELEKQMAELKEYDEWKKTAGAAPVTAAH